MTLRPANFALYIAATLLILAAAAYSLAVHLVWYQQLAAVLAVLIALPWGGHYALLRYVLDEKGITQKSLFGSKHIPWGEGTAFTLRETRTQETAHTELRITRGEDTLLLSSAILSPEQLEDLITDLRRRGALPPAEENDKGRH